MKAKMSYIIAGKGVPLDFNYTKLFAIPELLDKDTEALATFTKSDATVQEIELATFIRSLARSSKSERAGMDQGDVDDRWASQLIEDVRHGGTSGKGGSEGRQGMMGFDSQEPQRSLEQDLEQGERVNELVGVMDGEEDGEISASSSEDEDETEEDDDLGSDGET